MSEQVLDLGARRLSARERDADGFASPVAAAARMFVPGVLLALRKPSI